MKSIGLKLGTQVAIMAILLSGCSLWPRRVEFFSDKVEKYPAETAKYAETQRKAAQLARDEAVLTVNAAIQEGSTTNLLNPARDVAMLTGSIAQSLGPPSRDPSVGQAVELASGLRFQQAKFNRKVDYFIVENNDNAGKKIEGTGWFSVPYFLWVAIIIGVVVIAWFALKTFLSVAAIGNPGAAIGVGAMNVASKTVGKGFQQVVNGGEEFQQWVDKEIENSQLKQKIQDAFWASHVKNQDEDVQAIVKQLTEKK